MEIHWRNPGPLDESERRAAEKHLEELAKDHRDLIDVWIDIEETPHHRSGSEHVTIRGQVRQAALVAQGRDIETGLALRDALRTFGRELRELRARRTARRTERVMEPPLRGVVDRVFWGEDYGFLIADDGEEVYFHRNALAGGLDWNELVEGQGVAFNLEAGDEGPQATVVLPPSPGQ